MGASGLVGVGEAKPDIRNSRYPFFRSPALGCQRDHLRVHYHSFRHLFKVS